MDFGDITPTGVTEKFNFEVTPQLNIAVNFGQYIFYDNPESGYAVTPTRVATTNAAGGRDRFHHGQRVLDQPGGHDPDRTEPQGRRDPDLQRCRHHLQADEQVTVTAGPGLLRLPAARLGGHQRQRGRLGRWAQHPQRREHRQPARTQPGRACSTRPRSTATRPRDDLAVAMFNGDVKFPVGPFKGKFYWDFAYNFEGSERAHAGLRRAEKAASRTATTWLAGFQIGRTQAQGRLVRLGGLSPVRHRLARPEPQRSQLRAQPPEHAGFPHQRWATTSPTGSRRRCGTTARGTWTKTSTLSCTGAQHRQQRASTTPTRRRT